MTPPPVRETAGVRRHLAEAHGRHFESRDGGATWEAVIDGERRELRIAGADTGRLFASDKHGLYQSRDGGKTWSPVGDAEDLRAHPWKRLDDQRSK